MDAVIKSVERSNNGYNFTVDIIDDNDAVLSTQIFTVSDKATSLEYVQTQLLYQLRKKLESLVAQTDVETQIQEWVAQNQGPLSSYASTVIKT